MAGVVCQGQDLDSIGVMTSLDDDDVLMMED
jgi:hypothetical protein